MVIAAEPPHWLAWRHRASPQVPRVMPQRASFSGRAARPATPASSSRVRADWTPAAPGSTVRGEAPARPANPNDARCGLDGRHDASATSVPRRVPFEPARCATIPDRPGRTPAVLRRPASRTRAPANRPHTVMGCKTTAWGRGDGDAQYNSPRGSQMIKRRAPEADMWCPREADDRRVRAKASRTLPARPDAPTPSPRLHPPGGRSHVPGRRALARDPRDRDVR
jgi:hypothetical protein